MSLLNAALRKKELENRPSKIAGLFNKSVKAQGKARLRLYGLSAGLLLVMGLAVFLGLHLLSSLKKTLPAPLYSENQAVWQKSEPIATALPTQNDAAAQSPQDPVKLKTDSPPETILQPSAQVEKPAVTKKIGRKPKKSIAKTLVESPKKISKAEDNAPSVPAKSNRSDASGVFYEKAVRYHRQNRLAEAIQMYQQVLRKNPHDQDTLFNMAAAYLEHRDFSSALPILNGLSEKNPRDPQVLLNLAIARLGLGEPESALALLDQVERINGAPTFEFYFHKALALSRLGRPDEAEVFYKMAEKNNPDNSSLLFNLAVLYDKMERYQEALPYYRAFLAKKGPVPEKEKESVERRVLILSGFMERQQEKPRQPNSPAATGD